MIQLPNVNYYARRYGSNDNRFRAVNFSGFGKVEYVNEISKG